MESKIVSAVGVIATQGGDSSPLSRRIEVAMSQAVLKAVSEGVSILDTAQIKARMDSSREEVLRAAGLLDAGTT